MENEKFLEILYMIRACLLHDDWCTARNYSRLEIDKLINNVKKFAI